MTQKEMVLEYMADYGSITSLDAFREFGITRLADVIYKLKNDGHNIVTTMETSKNRYGKAVSYGRYTFE